MECVPPLFPSAMTANPTFLSLLKVTFCSTFFKCYYFEQAILPFLPTVSSIHPVHLSICLIIKMESKSTSSSHIETAFLAVANRIIKSEGHDSSYIVPHLKTIQPDELVHSPAPPMIRRPIWQKLIEFYNIYKERSYQRQNAPILSSTGVSSTCLSSTANVFINGKLTTKLFQNKSIREGFESKKRLFQYLNWTLKINQMAQTMTVMEGRNGGRVMVFDVELHDQRQQRLYALCTVDHMKWQLLDLVTASELTILLGIKQQSLPRGVRAVSSQFEQYRLNSMKSNLKDLKRRILSVDQRQRMKHLKCPRTGNSASAPDKVLTVKLSMFRGAVRKALMDENVNLIPIVSRVLKWRNSVDTNGVDGNRKRDENFRFNLCFV